MAAPGGGGVDNDIWRAAMAARTIKRHLGMLSILYHSRLGTFGVTLCQ